MIIKAGRIGNRFLFCYFYVEAALLPQPTLALDSNGERRPADGLVVSAVVVLVDEELTHAGGLLF